MRHFLIVFRELLLFTYFHVSPYYNQNYQQISWTKIFDNI